MSTLQEVRDDIDEAEQQISEIVRELHDKHDVSIDSLRLLGPDDLHGGTYPSHVEIEVSL